MKTDHMMLIKLGMVAIVIVGLYFANQGLSMHEKVAEEEATYHQLLDSYYSQNKVVRDRAETGSQMAQDLVAISQYPSRLMELKLLGLGKILTGIFALLFGILLALIVMPKRLAAHMKSAQKS